MNSTENIKERMAGVTPESKAPIIAPKKKATVESKLAVVPRPLGELLDAVEGFLRRYVVFAMPEQARLIALWVVHTWLINAFDYTAYLNVFSASKRSGKSRVLEVLELICRNPELTQSGSSAAIIRSIDEGNPMTLLLDEVDGVFSRRTMMERIICGGFSTRGSSAGRNSCAVSGRALR
jgi:hypothetical protein